MTKYIAALLLMLISSVEAETFEGCYSHKAEIHSFTTNESDVKTSFIEIKMTDNKYYARGMLWGGNFHLCEIASPNENSTEPLPLIVAGDKLVYEETDPKYNINCHLEFSVKDNVIHVSDENNDCSNRIFMCGEHAGLGNTKLPKTGKACAE